MASDESEVIKLEIGVWQIEEDAEGAEVEDVGEGNTILVPEAQILEPGTESFHGVSTDSLRSHQETVALEHDLIAEVRRTIPEFFSVCLISA